MKRTLLLLAAGLFLLASCKPPEPPKITATDTGKSGPGGQTIKGGDVTIIKGVDKFWDFEVMTTGKRRGVFCIPETVFESLPIYDWHPLMSALEHLLWR